MAAMILIAFLAVVAILGGWWLKKERENQKNDLIRQGKLAARKFDEIAVPKKKPKKRKRKKREGSFWDPKYVPPEIPDKQQLGTWLKEAERIVDELMPRVAAHRLAKERHEPIGAALTAAEAQLVKSYKSDAVTEVEAREWLDSLEAKLRAYHAAQTDKAASDRELNKLYAPVVEPGVRLRWLLSQANAWELYKAPESFHEMLELMTLLYDDLKYEFDLDNAQINFREKSNRKHGFGGADRSEGEGIADTGTTSVVDTNEDRRDDREGDRKAERKDIDREYGFSGSNISGEDKSWQRASRRRSWDWREAEPEPDAEITASTRSKLESTLKDVAALAAALCQCISSQKKYREAGNHIELARPTKPADQDVDAVLTAVMSWAKTYQAAKTQLWNDAFVLKRAMQTIENTLPALKVAAGKLKDARIPEQDNIARDVIVRACDQLSAFVGIVPDMAKTALTMTKPYAIGEAEQQSDKDAASNLRNLMRKAGFAMAQAEIAKANLEAAKNEHVSQSETVPPVLTQSSASAFINAHARMVEISIRNSQKTEAHSAKVKQLQQQQTERQQQATQAVRAVYNALSALGYVREGWSANLEQMNTAANLFYSAFNK